MRAPLLFLTLLLAMVATACGADFPPEEIIEKDRPLAGRVSVAGDPTRSTPAPGETATYEFLVASHEKQVGWSYFFVACPIIRTAGGVAICDSTAQMPVFGLPTMVDPQPTTPPFDLPSITFTIPDAATLGDATEAAILGVICPDTGLDQTLLTALMSGDLSGLATIGNPCADKSKNGLLVSSPFPIERVPSDRNHTPLAQAVSYVTDVVTPIVAGTPWTSEAADDEPAGGCSGMGYPEISASTAKLGFVFELDPAARETYDKPNPIAGEPPIPTTEVPDVRGYATAGTFHILVDNQQTAGQLLELTWTPPATIDPALGGSQLVRFWFLVRDDRQGARPRDLVGRARALRRSLTRARNVTPPRRRSFDALGLDDGAEPRRDDARAALAREREQRLRRIVPRVESEVERAPVDREQRPASEHREGFERVRGTEVDAAPARVERADLEHHEVERTVRARRSSRTAS